MNIELGPTGNLIQGNLFDINRRAFTERLRDFDSQLYLQWNPDKRNRMGCWEIRRRPDKKTAVYQGEYAGARFYSLEWKEEPLIAHILDVPVLSPAVFTKLASMDTWNDKYWVRDLEYREGKHVEAKESKARDELKYRAKEYKRELRDFMEMVNSGLNPARIAQHWK